MTEEEICNSAQSAVERLDGLSAKLRSYVEARDVKSASITTTGSSDGVQETLTSLFMLLFGPKPIQIKTTKLCGESLV